VTLHAHADPVLAAARAAARTYHDDQGRLWHDVPTVTQCEKVDLVRGRRPRGEPRVYTNYARFTTTYRKEDGR
jgi:hypothetical protein